MTIVCVRQGEKYGVEYTRMLRRMVAEFAGEELVVVGDGDEADYPLRDGLKGWHAKLELFSPQLEHLRPCLYFDLDTFILGDIGDLATFAETAETLWIIRDFNMDWRGNSGVMVIPREVDRIWENRRTDVPDGDYLSGFTGLWLQTRFDGIVSYKRTSREAPAGRVVCFHGQPKPDNAPGWARDVWREYSR